MGIYIRKDSKFYWMLLERPRQKPICQSTKIPITAHSAAIRKQNRQDAEDVYAAAMGDLARTRHDLPTHDATPISFSDYALWYDRNKISTHRGADRERGILKHLVAFFGARDLTTIDRTRAAEFMTWRAAQQIHGHPIRPSTINREVALLKTMLTTAIGTHLKASPLAGLKLLRVVKRRKRTLTFVEEQRLLAQLEPADRALYIVAVDTLIRLSNVLNLKRSEYRKTHLALEDSKTGPYEVPLSDRARKALDRLPKEGEYFFPHRRIAASDVGRRSIIRVMLQRACAKTSPPIPYGRAIGGITFHTATRATGATRMLQAGHDPKTVQRVGNWHSFDQMGEYLQTDDARMHAAVNSIGISITSHLRRSRKPQKSAKSLRKRRVS